jgi:hypothetical protein
VSEEGQARGFPWRLYIILLVVILLFALWPIGSVMVAGAIADSHGCVLHEGFANPCVIGGTDWGSTLYAMGVMGWFMLATVPLGGGALLVWLVVLVIHWLAWRRNAGRQA